MFGFDWYRKTDEEKTVLIATLKCDRHPDSEFVQGTYYRGGTEPIIFHCSECLEKSKHTDTRAYWCDVCGMIYGNPSRHSYESSPEAWIALAGRKGSHFYCENCRELIGVYYWMVS